MAVNRELAPIGGEHGISSVFPTLADIIGYKDGSLKVSRGYPRFVMHPALRDWALSEFPGTEWFWPVDTIESARFMIKHYCRLDASRVTVRGDGEGAIISAPTEEEFKILAEDIRNTGFTMSSRKAVRLTRRAAKPDGSAIEQKARETIAGYEQVAESEWTYLFPSGMAATFMAMLAAFRSERPGALIVGNPYFDTRLLFTRFALRHGYPPPVFVEVDGDWEGALNERIGIVFLELPTNPLVRVGDLEAIVKAARDKGCRVLVDNTIASSHNSAPLSQGADAVVQSTTKFLNGMNDHIGGVVMLHPQSAGEIRSRLETLIGEANCHLDPEEASVLADNLPGFPERMRKINANGLTVARYLERHPSVERVYYPYLASHPDHKRALEALKPGAGGVLSFALRGSSLAVASAFYDHCTLGGKGPSLGGEQTLLCPIALLTFFTSTDAELASMGLDRYLFRLSVGTETTEDIIRDLENGLKAIGR